MRAAHNYGHSLAGLSFGFLPVNEHYEYRRLKWWHIRKTKIRVLNNVRLYEWGVSLDSSWRDIAPPYPQEEQ